MSEPRIVSMPAASAYIAMVAVALTGFFVGSIVARRVCLSTASELIRDGVIQPGNGSVANTGHANVIEYSIGTGGRMQTFEEMREMVLASPGKWTAYCSRPKGKACSDLKVGDVTGKARGETACVFQF